MSTSTRSRKKAEPVQPWTAFAPQLAQQPPAPPWLKALLVSRIVVALEVLLGVVRRPEIAARLALLPKSVFDAGALSRLPKLGPALWALEQAARSWVDPGRVPAALRDEALERRERMKVLVFHHFAKDEVVMGLAAGIGAVTGYAALASDLERLSAILAPRLSVVRHDKTWFDPQDVVRGRQLAYAILKAQATEVEGPPHALARLLSLVFADYEELRAAVDFVCRKDADKPEIPHLVTAAQAPAKKKEDEAAEDEADGAEAEADAEDAAHDEAEDEAAEDAAETEGDAATDGGAGTETPVEAPANTTGDLPLTG